jgi:hypothetical protein
MEKYSQAEKDLLVKILEASAQTAPVELSFGSTRKGVCQTGIVIKSAPQKVLDVIWRTESVTMLEPDGLHIVIANTTPRE